MGGNVIINQERAAPIDLRQHSRQSWLQEVESILELVDSQLSLWALGYSTYLSGSTKFLFDPSIADQELIQYKQTFGDIDIMFDQRRIEEVRDWINTFTHPNLFGHIDGGNQFITLWKTSFGNIQIDLEASQFEYYEPRPEPWSYFCRGSDWEDTKQGIKGVFHKYLMRSLPYKDDHVKWAFSVPYGLRNKDARFRHFCTRLDVIIYSLLGFIDPENDVEEELELMHSFRGLIQLIRRQFTPEQQQRVFHHFCHCCFHQGAQLLYRDDPMRDAKEKATAVQYLMRELPHLQFTPELSTMHQTYYRKHGLQRTEEI